MKHTWQDGCVEKCGVCMICNLDICTVCGLAEGELTSECPGAKVKQGLADAVYAGTIDYKAAHGWITPDSPHWTRRRRTK